MDGYGGMRSERKISQLAGGTAKTCTDPNDPDPKTFYLIDPLEENRTFHIGQITRIWHPVIRRSYERLWQPPGSVILLSKSMTKQNS